MNRVEASLDQQRIDLSANQCIPAGGSLQRDLALYRRVGRFAVGIEVSRSMIPLD